MVQYDDNYFGYDFDLNGEMDLYLETSKDGGKYISTDGTVLAYGKLENNIENSTHTLFIENFHNKNKYDEGWTQCFESAAGSAAGVTAAVVSAFFTPAATAGLYGGFAIGCAILN